MWKKIRVPVISFILLVIMLLGVLVWNKIIHKDDKSEEPSVIDVSDANNVPSVDKRLGNGDYAITQSYLRNYVIHKGGTWYESKGTVKKIQYQKDDALLTIQDDDGNSIQAVIEKSKCDVKKNDFVYFIGVIRFKNYQVTLSKISKEEIHYNSSISVTIEELQDYFKKLSNTYFVINGYMVTDSNQYKLYESKEAYQKDSSAGNYFLIEWDGEFLYTGNQDVKVRCQLSDTYQLSSCTLEK